jgi:hypothetical protein
VETEEDSQQRQADVDEQRESERAGSAAEHPFEVERHVDRMLAFYVDRQMAHRDCCRDSVMSTLRHGSRQSWAIFAHQLRRHKCKTDTDDLSNKTACISVLLSRNPDATRITLT